jgi:hypothetical protein
MQILNFVSGLVTGMILTYLLYVFVKNLRKKKGIKYEEYKGLPLLIRLKDVLRNIVYEYNIKRHNEDFLLNILYAKTKVMQVMHRAHFPYLLKNKTDIKFGLALYIPITKLSESQKIRIEEILIEESDKYNRQEEPFDYHVIDLGNGIRHGGYLISRLLSEVFEFNLDPTNFNFELFSNGKLPYIGRDYEFNISSN